MNKKGFSSLIVLVLVFALLIAGGVYSYYQFLNATPTIYVPISDNTEPSATAESDIPDDWETYESTDYGFTFRYPADANLNDTGSNYMAVNYMGQKQIDSGRTQTEIFDGYAFNVVDLSEEGDFESLDEFANSRMNQLSDICTAVGDPKSGMINGNEYISVESECLGNFNIYYFENNGMYFEVGTLVAGDEEDTPKYVEIISTILSTFEFVN